MGLDCSHESQVQVFFTLSRVVEKGRGRQSLAGRGVPITAPTRPAGTRPAR